MKLWEAVKEPELTSLGNITFEELYGHADESPFNTEYGIKFIGKEADDDESKHAKELSMEDEGAADDVIDESVDMANNQDANLDTSAAKPTDSNPFADVFEENLRELLSDTLKNILPQLLEESVKKALPKFDKRAKKTIKAEVPNLILKPLNKEFNALNT
nr:hypothetical protein [Tanacetum cinerariifolium]